MTPRGGTLRLREMRAQKLAAASGLLLTLALILFLASTLLPNALPAPQRIITPRLERAGGSESMEGLAVVFPLGFAPVPVTSAGIASHVGVSPMPAASTGLEKAATSADTASHVGVSPVPAASTGLEKADWQGSCDLGTFIKASPCRKDVRGAACCKGLRAAFANKCACRPLPNIVASNGGKPIFFLLDYARCLYAPHSHGESTDSDEPGVGIDEESSRVDGESANSVGVGEEEIQQHPLQDTSREIAPVDFVADTHACMDQRGWCNDMIPGVDVRLEAFNVGYAQIATRESRQESGSGSGWVRLGASPENLPNVARALCRAIGFSDPKGMTSVPDSLPDSHGAPTLPDSSPTLLDFAALPTGKHARLDLTRGAHKHLHCSAEAAARGMISECVVTDLNGNECPGGHPDFGCPGALWLECEGRSMPTLCARVGQSAHTLEQPPHFQNHSGVEPETILLPNKLQYDGYADDYSRYVTLRSADGLMASYKAEAVTAAAATSGDDGDEAASGHGLPLTCLDPFLKSNASKHAPQEQSTTLKILEEAAFQKQLAHDVEVKRYALVKAMGGQAGAEYEAAQAGFASYLKGHAQDSWSWAR
ncbi:hypothetical protein T492DRAFT_981891 [Pavlovales sp. CCMP2436]|nr:hypothetical protein T492DRAFT_981891 [Pavlovales sp. CCMP2436]